MLHLDDIKLGDIVIIKNDEGESERAHVVEKANRGGVFVLIVETCTRVLTIESYCETFDDIKKVGSYD